MAIPQKSSVTPEGRFYQLVKKTLIEANYLVKQGLPVYKQLVSNPRVLNNKLLLTLVATPSTSPFSAPNQTNTVFPGYLNDLSWDPIDSYIYPGSTRLSRQYEFDQDNQKNLFLETGWFFFDWEKALKRTSLIAQIFYIDKLEKFFGKGICNRLFSLDTVYVHCNMKNTIRNTVSQRRMVT